MIFKQSLKKLLRHFIPRKDFSSQPIMFFNSKCNGRCIFCLAENVVSMSKKEINIVLNSGYDEISILGGEPLLCKDLEDRVRQIKEKGVKKVHVFTNGLLLNKERLDSLMEAGVTSFNFNFPAHTPKEHEIMSGLPGNLPRQTENIRRACLKSKNAATLVCVVTTVNYKLLQDYVIYATENFPGLFYILFIFVKVSGRVNNNKWLLPNLTDTSREMLKALKTAKEKGITCLIDGMPLCFLPGWEAYSWDIDNKLGGKINYTGINADLEVCRHCELSDICVGPRKDYVEMYGDKEFKPAHADKEEIIRLVKRGQVNLNTKN